MKAKRSHRPYHRFIALTAIILVTPIFAFATAIAATGTVTVELDERAEGGTRIYVPVPALLVDVAVLAAPLIIPDEQLDQIRTELAPFRNGLQAFAEELETCPNGVLVEVVSPDEHLRVSKRWRTFEFELDDRDTDLRVSVPTRLASRFLDVL